MAADWIGLGSDMRNQPQTGHSMDLIEHRPSVVLIVITATLLFAGMTGCGAPQKSSSPVSLTGSTMGTSYHISLDDLPTGVDQVQLQAAIDERLQRINALMSTWQPDSEISRFNDGDSTEWFEVSKETAEVLSRAIEISSRTDGAFDVTVGPLVDLWSFGPRPSEREIPSREQIQECRNGIGFAKIDVRQTPPALRKEQAQIRIDLSAIAKGYAVDVVAEYLESLGVSGYLVEIGGETRVRGTKRSGEPWVIGIEAPHAGERKLFAAVSMADHSLATSGDYRNFFEIEGTRYSHTIDPRTGWPVTFDLASVSVSAPECITADAFATALMVLGPVDGYNLAVQENIAALFLVRDGNQLIERATPMFEQTMTRHELVP